MCVCSHVKVILYLSKCSRRKPNEVYTFKEQPLKGLNEKWHILDKFPWKTDINTDFCVLLYSVVEGGTWVIKALYQKHWFLSLFSFMRVVLNSDLEPKKKCIIKWWSMRSFSTYNKRTMNHCFLYEFNFPKSKRFAKFSSILVVFSGQHVKQKSLKHVEWIKYYMQLSKVMFTRNFKK